MMSNFLKHFEDGTLSINRNGEHFIQIMGQLGLSRLKWCDYLVWCENDFHLERIYFSYNCISRCFEETSRFLLQIWFTHFGQSARNEGNHRL